MTRALVLLSAALLGACTPWYREELLLGRSVSSGEAYALLSRADAAFQNGDWDTAERAYQRAAEADPRIGDAFFGLARVDLRRNRTASAIASARWARDRGVPDALEMLAEEWATLGLDPLALHALAPTDAAAPLGTPALSGYRPLAQAHALARQGRTREALSAYGRFVTEYGELDHPILRAWSDEIRRHAAPAAERLLESARKDATAGHHGRAMHTWAIAIRAAPSEMAVRTREEFARVARAAPAFHAVATQEGELAVRAAAEGRRAQALRAWRRAVAHAPWWAEARKGLALALSEVGLEEESRIQREWYLALAPDAPDAAAIRAWVPAPPVAAPKTAASARAPRDVHGAAGLTVAGRDLSISGRGVGGGAGRFVGAGVAASMSAERGRFGARAGARWETFDVQPVTVTARDSSTTYRQSTGGGSSALARILAEYRIPLGRGDAGAQARVSAGPRWEYHARPGGPLDLFPSLQRLGADVIVGVDLPLREVDLLLNAGITPFSHITQTPSGALGRAPRSGLGFVGELAATWRKGPWSTAVRASVETRETRFSGAAHAPAQNVRLREADQRLLLEVRHSL